MTFLCFSQSDFVKKKNFHVKKKKTLREAKLTTPNISIFDFIPDRENSNICCVHAAFDFLSSLKDVFKYLAFYLCSLIIHCKPHFGHSSK